VKSGKITPGTKIIVIRSGEKIGELKTDELKIGAQTVDRAEPPSECGVSYKGDLKIKPGDILEFVLVEEKLRSLKKRV